MRTIAIGDIHGCSLALATLLEYIAPQSGDSFVFLGDYIDRGPNSSGVIDLIIELAKSYPVLPLLGNHELLLLGSIEAREPNAFWLNKCGGDETMISYGGSLDNIPPAHIQFLRCCQRYYETDKCIFLHANYAADKPLSEQPETQLFWQHLNMFIPEPHISGKTVIVGHTPQRTGEILNLGHLVCIDTGCCMGGWLTALNVDSGQYWQVNRFGERRGQEGQ
jgi:serine/threonine protein phosphatase 1